MDGDFDREREALRRFRHPIPGGGPPREYRPRPVGQGLGRPGGKMAGVSLLALIVGGAFLVVPPSPRLRFHPLDTPDVAVSEIRAGVPLTASADITGGGYSGLFAIRPDRRLQWLHPRSDREAHARVAPGRHLYFGGDFLTLRRRGLWVFVHVVGDEPLTGLLQDRVAVQLARRLRWPATSARLEELLRTHFTEVLIAHLRCTGF